MTDTLKEEERIRRHFKSFKKRAYREDWSKTRIVMFMARRWKRPCREIRRIIEGREA